MLSNTKKTIKKLRKIAKKQIKPLFLLLTILMFAFPDTGYAMEDHQAELIGPVAAEVISAYYPAGLPDSSQPRIKKTMKIIVTAYNSELGQTDSTPWTTASGTTCRDGVVAANFLPIGAIVRFPDVYGDKEFRVEDRMNARYYYRADIWMADHSEAVKFGAKYLKIEVL